MNVRATMTSVLWLSTACSEGTPPPAEAQCPMFAAGVQSPVVVQSSSAPVAGMSDVRYPVLTDESGVYWFDTAGTLYASAHGDDGAPIVLRPAPPDEVGVLSIVADASTLYWAEAAFFQDGLTYYLPPGRVYSIPKSGGDPALVLEDSEAAVSVLGVVGNRIIVERWDVPGIVAVSEDGSTEMLVPDAEPGSAQVIEGKLYWAVADESSNDGDRYSPNLWRMDPDAAPELVTRIEGGRYLAAGGFVLWRQERTHYDPLVLDENYVMLQESSGCIKPLPARGETISSDSVMDGRHVYWMSFNGLAGFSPGDPDFGLPLIRVDLRTGALEQVVTPGFEPTLSDNIIGQTSDKLYFIIGGLGGDVVAVDKP